MRLADKGKDSKRRTWMALLVSMSLVVAGVSQGPAQAHSGTSEPSGSHANSDPAYRVSSMRPHQVFNFHDGAVSVVDHGLDDGERAHAEALADSLNTGAANGWLGIKEGSSEVTFSPGGKAEVFKRATEHTGPCNEISNLRVSWQGYSFDLETTCTDAEIEAMIAARDLATSDGTVTRNTSNHVNPIAPLFGKHFWCWVSAAGLVFGVVGAIFLMAFPPTSGLGLAWVAVVFTFGTSYIGTVANCTGIRSVQVNSSGVSSVDFGGELRLPASHRTVCYYQYSSSWKYDSALRRNVPTSIKWNC